VTRDDQKPLFRCLWHALRYSIGGCDYRGRISRLCEIITQIWRIKQLEYTWLRSLMRRYEDFSAITRDSLCYTLRCLGLKYDPAVFDRIMGNISISISIPMPKRRWQR